MTFGGRYVILLMALFSIYTGLIYNEFFSVPFSLFGRSAYECRDSSCRQVALLLIRSITIAYTTLWINIYLLFVNWLFTLGFSISDVSTVGLIKVRSAYPFGVDPEWHGSRSELPFLNSLKMKMSILLGVAQMNLGIVMSYFNAKFFENTLNVW